MCVRVCERARTLVYQRSEVSKELFNVLVKQLGLAGGLHLAGCSVDSGLLGRACDQGH